MGLNRESFEDDLAVQCLDWLDSLEEEAEQASLHLMPAEPVIRQ